MTRIRNRNRNRIICATLLIAALVFFAGTPAARQSGENESHPKVIKLRQAVIRGLESNFKLKAEKLVISQREEDVTVEDARFDPTVKLGVSAQDRKSPTGVVFYENEYEETQKILATAGIVKLFETGLQTRLVFETYRSENNFRADSLDPNYRNILVLNLTQPILKGFGVDINKTQVHISENFVRMAFLEYANAARLLTQRIELAWHDLARAEGLVKYRVKSRELARELLQANRQRLEYEMATITDVHEAWTAVTGRDEKVIFARQQLEMTSNRLKDLMETGPNDPLFAKLVGAEPLEKALQSYPPLKKAISASLSNRTDLKQARTGIDNQELMITFLENQKLPRVDLVASAGVSGLSGEERQVKLLGPSTRSPFEGDYTDSFASMVEDDGYQWSAGVRFEYPLGNRAGNSRLTRGKLEKRRLIYMVKRMENQIRTQVKNAHVSVSRSYQRVEKTKKFVKLAQNTLEHETRRLEEGLSDTFRILDHQENLVEANIRHISALADFHKSLSTLYAAMGTNLDRHGIRLRSD